jgi:heme-degrading monooxygenase HmoA
VWARKLQQEGRAELMIMRQWKGRVPAEKAADYIKFLNTSGFKDYAETPGNLAVYAFQRTEAGVTEIVLVTLWESIEAIKRFAGEDYEKAHYYHKGKDFLLEFEPLVKHYDVAFASLKHAALK